MRCCNSKRSWLVLLATVAIAACGSNNAAVGPAQTDAGPGATADGQTADLGGEDTDSGGVDAAGDGDATGGGTDDVGSDGDTAAGTDDAIGADATDGGATDDAIGEDATDGGATDDAITDDATDGGATDDAITDDATDGGATDDAITDDASDGGATDDAIAGDASDGGATDDASADDASDTGPGESDAADSGSIDGGAIDGGAIDAGPAVACKVDGDCLAPVNACQTVGCANGACVVSAKADNTACDDGNACTDADGCKAGACAGAAKQCDDSNACTDDNCKDGACLNAPNAAACDDGNACTGKDVCKSGACAGDPAAVSCDDTNPCTADACAPIGGCSHASKSGSCDDGSACTTGDACKDGACAAGSAVMCNDDNACTTDKCDAASGLCLFGASPAGGACEDGDACTTGDTCNQGKCKAGAAKACDDGNPCTDDSCDTKAGCVAKPNAATCDDGNACTGGDLCKDGKCGGAAKVCDDANPCTDDGCDVKTGCTKANNTTPCSLDNVCVDAVCKAGVCTDNGVPKNCDDANPCTVDKCDTKLGCQHANASDGSTCSTGDACVNPSTCAAGKCIAGAKADCDDGNLCTTDACNGTTGCVWTPNTTSCDDGNSCTIGDACALVPGKGPSCAPGKPIDIKTCDDNNPCTTDSCNTKIGCVHSANTITCDDANACTTGEACAAGKCAGGQQVNCDDGKVCTTDQCDKATGNCSWSANTAPCDDGSACTAVDACNGGKCVSGAAKVCNDGNPCTTDSCDPKTGACVTAVADGVACDDLNACTSADLCGGGKCAGKVAVTCDDANVCTTDACDPKSAACSHVNNTAACEDGNKCTTTDLCAAGVCIAGSKTSCDDANGCTVDACDAASGKCLNTPVVDGSVCDDGIPCTPASSCKAGQCLPKDACWFFGDAFTCADDGKNWTIDSPASPTPGVARNVSWQVDKAPAVGSTAEQSAHECTMNFNDDKDYCDGFQSNGQNYCLVPAGTARSPVIDWTALKGTSGAPTLVFDAYYDVDPNGVNGTANAPQAVVRDAVSKAVLATFLLPKGNSDLKVWKPGLTFNLTAALGHKFTVEFSLYEPASPGYDQGNQGAGFFVDNFGVKLTFPPETCGDGIDNDGNGKADCADPVCVGLLACSGVKLIYDDMVCGATGWTNSSTDPKVFWAIDNTPVAVTAPTGTCTLNYNNGVDYNNGQINSGNATWSSDVDAAGLSQLIATFRFYYATEVDASSAGFDNAWLQVSTDNFTCPNGANNCTTANTLSYLLDKTVQKTWIVKNVDLQAFAGKKFKVRFRFDTVDNQFNNFAGIFIDDFHLMGAK